MDNAAPAGRPTGDPADQSRHPAGDQRGDRADRADRGHGRGAAAASRRPRDMVISLLVLLLPVILLVGGYQLLAGRNEPVRVDPAPALAEAEAAGVDVATPRGLGEGWVPVSAAFRETGAGATLRVGYAAPGGGSAQLVQSTVPAERLLPAELSGSAAPAGSVEVAGRDWQRYRDEREPALVLLEPGRTILVIGSVAGGELRDLAASLR